jgi:hypothetical protein
MARIDVLGEMVKLGPVTIVLSEATAQRIGVDPKRTHPMLSEVSLHTTPHLPDGTLLIFPTDAVRASVVESWITTKIECNIKLERIAQVKAGE